MQYLKPFFWPLLILILFLGYTSYVGVIMIVIGAVIVIAVEIHAKSDKQKRCERRQQIQQQSKEKNLLAKNEEDTEESMFHFGWVSKKQIDNLQTGDTVTLGQLIEEPEKEIRPSFIDKVNGMEILNMSSYADNKVSFTDDKCVLERFKLNNIDLKDPEHVIELVSTPPIRRKIDSEMIRLFKDIKKSNNRCILFKAEKMEQKWDVWGFKDVLIFARSWTGRITYALQWGIKKDQLIIKKIQVDEDFLEGQPPLYATMELKFLLETLVFGKFTAHPIPAELKNDIPAAEEYSFHRHGCQGRIGIFVE